MSTAESTHTNSTRLPWAVAAIASLAAIAALMALVLGGGGGATASSGTGLSVDEQGSSSPEDAAQGLADAIADGRLDDAASMFATRSLATGYSFTAYVERTGAVLPQTYLPSPAYEGLSTRAQLGQVGTGLSMIVRSLLVPDDDLTASYTTSSGRSAAEWETALDPAGFDDVSVTRVAVLSELPADSDYSEQTAQWAEAWSADGLREAAVLFDTAQGEKMLGITLVQIDGSWYVMQLGGPLLGLSSFQAELTTTADFDALIESAESKFGSAG